MEQGQDVNQQGSQATDQGAPNPAGNSAEPSGDRASQLKAWETANNNKAQQIAAEKRQLEAEKAAWAQQRNQYQGQPQGYSQQQAPQQQYQQGQSPQGYQNPQGQFLPSNYQDLVRELGVDAANQLVAAQNQQAGLVLSQLNPVMQRLEQNEVRMLVQGIDAKGKDLYGKEYQEKRNEVLNLIANGDPANGVPAGCTVEYAMFHLRGGEDGLRQRLTDQAYKQQEQKEQGNVSQQGAGPSQSAVTKTTGIDAAIAAAKKELGWVD